MAICFTHDSRNFSIKAGDYQNAVKQLTVNNKDIIGLMVDYDSTFKNISTRNGGVHKTVCEFVFADKAKFTSVEVDEVRGSMKSLNLPLAYKSVLGHVVNSTTNDGFEFDDVGAW